MDEKENMRPGFQQWSSHAVTRVIGPQHQDQLMARNDAADQPKRCCHTRHCPGAYNNKVMSRSMVDMFETAREKKPCPMLIPSLAATNFVHQFLAGSRVR